MRVRGGEAEPWGASRPRCPELQAYHSNTYAPAVAMNAFWRLHRLSALQTEATLSNWRPLCSGGWAPIEAAAARQGKHVVYLWRLVQPHRCCSLPGRLAGLCFLPPRTPSPSSSRSTAAVPAPASHTLSIALY